MRAACAIWVRSDVVVTGNLKFDVAVPPRATRIKALRCARCSARDRPVLVLASTRDGEEALLLDALARTMRCRRRR